MPNIAGNKMLKHLDRITGKRLPITADIFLTNYCNNNCPYCTYKRWELDEGACAMPYDEFVRYAERLRSLGVLGFSPPLRRILIKLPPGWNTVVSIMG